MSKSNGQAVLSLEDSIREIIREPADRKAFRLRWPMYDVQKLTESISSIEDDIVEFENAIIKANAQKRQWTELIGECQRRDTALATLRERSA